MAKAEDERFVSRQIAAALRAKIEDGTYPVGARLPPARQLAAEHGAAVNTAAAAMRVLQAQGLVEIRGTAGTYVRDQSGQPAENPDDLRAELTDLRERLHRTREELASAERVVSGLLERLPPEGAAQ